ncbi:penicillin-binding protein [bacterium]|nr:penicillin-binding protein [bacterium]
MLKALKNQKVGKPAAPARARLASRHLSRVLGVAAWCVMLFVFYRLLDRKPVEPSRLSKGVLAQSIGPAVASGEFPAQIEVDLPPGHLRAKASYTLNPEHQHRIEKLLSSYRPDYAAFVALDATTGRVLVLSSYTHAKESEPQNLALKASFPAASIFKIVTAAAAIDQGVMSADTIIPFNGANHTLYRRNVTDQKLNRWTRQITLRDAFARSVNTVFAKIGMYVLEPPQLKDYAERFQFNKRIPADMPVEAGQLQAPGEDPWGLAEMASGFNRMSSMSPLQGAMIAAAVVNDGVMMEPYVVEGLQSDSGEILYQANPSPTAITMKPETAEELRTMMNETVRSGTSRSAFRTLLRKKYIENLEIGGKTGSLRGQNPQGKCDWFVGYAKSADQRIAIAALTVNRDLWRVKASYLARVFLEEYFRPR